MIRPVLIKAFFNIILVLSIEVILNAIKNEVELNPENAGSPVMDAGYNKYK